EAIATGDHMEGTGMADSVDTRRAGGRMERSRTGLVLSLERWTRAAVKELTPGTILHNRPRAMHSRQYLRTWTDQRLQLGKHFWLFVLGLNNSGTTLLVDLLKSHPETRWLPNEGQYLTTALPLPRSVGVPRNFSTRLDVFHWTEEADPTPA